MAQKRMYNFDSTHFYSVYVLFVESCDEIWLFSLLYIFPFSLTFLLFELVS